MLNEIINILRERNCIPLYIIRSGSFLYGTNSEISDIDYKVIFLPSKRDILLGKQANKFEFSTASKAEKNTKDDIDISCKSLHTFLRDVARGETGALDIAFSFTNEEAVLYKDPIMDIMFNNINKFFNIKNMNAFIGYANSQAIRYSLKGKKYNLIKNILDFLHENKFNKISDFAEILDEKFHDDANLFFNERDGNKFIHILNSDYMLTHSYEYFLNCIEEKFKKYEERTKKCSEETVDWKALSHAVRCISECKELMNSGIIQFPLKNKDFIKSIKYGNENFNDIIRYIERELEDIDSIIRSNTCINTFDSDFVDDFILKFF